jgi:hypothetical protein
MRITVERLANLRLAVSRDPSLDFTPEFRRDFLGGVMALRHHGQAITKYLTPIPTTPGRTGARYR